MLPLSINSPIFYLYSSDSIVQGKENHPGLTSLPVKIQPTRSMRPPTAVVVIATIVLALYGADATVETTCKQAVDKNTHVKYDFCVLELRKHHPSSDADTCGLAKVAANMGINKAYGAIHDISRRRRCLGNAKGCTTT